MSFVGLRIELGQAILCEYDSEGILRAQPDGAGEARLGSFEILAPLGLVARAPSAATDSTGKPSGGGGCKLFVLKDGTDYRVMLLGDQRDLVKIPPLPVEGGAALVAPGCPVPSFHVISSKDGTHQFYVEVGDSAHVATIGLDANGDSIIEWVHARGMALTFFRDTAVLKNRTGNAYVELNDEGIILNGNCKVTGAFDVGATSFPLVMAPPLVVELQALQTALVTVGAALTAITDIPFAAAASPAAAAAVAAIGVAQAALATFGATGPTLMTKGF